MKTAAKPTDAFPARAYPRPESKAPLYALRIALQWKNDKELCGWGWWGGRRQLMRYREEVN